MLHGLSPGDYRIIARIADQVISQKLVRITDRHLEDVALMVGRTQPLSGKIVLEDPPEGVQASQWSAYFYSILLPQSWPDPESEIKEDLHFRIEQVPPETYRFEVMGLPTGAYLKALRVGGQRLPPPRADRPRGRPGDGRSGGYCVRCSDGCRAGQAAAVPRQLRGAH